MDWRVGRIRARCRCLLRCLCMFVPLTAVVGGLLTVLVVFVVSSWGVQDALTEADVSAMDTAFGHVAGSMQPLLDANRSAVAIAGAIQPMSNNTVSLPQVRPKLFVAFAVQPRLAQVAYAGVDGAAFAYYRAEAGGAARALFTDSRKRWTTQAVDPASGRLVGSATAASPHHRLPPLPNATLLTGRNGGARASLGEGWARRPGARMISFSAPINGGAGVVSAAVAVDDVLAAAASRAGASSHGAMDVYYAIANGTTGGGAPPSTKAGEYKPLLLSDHSRRKRSAMAREAEKRALSTVKCAASAIDAPKLGRLVVAGHRGGKYKAACTNFDVSGVKLAFRLVLHSHHDDGEMLRAMCIPVAIFVGALAVVAVMSCVLAARAARRAAAREAALDAELVRQKEALRQAERKSMNKSNAFASATHDIRSALAAVSGLVDVTRPEAQANPCVVNNLNQMGVCANKLLDILNSIMDTSKVESGKMQLEEAEFSMANVLEESVDMANVTGVQRGVEVVWDPCDFSVLRCAAVAGDCKRLKQILDNLLGNALKFTCEGHVVLRAWANRPIAGGGSVSAPSRFACPRRGGRSFFGCLLRAREERGDQDHVQNDPNSVEFYFEVVDTGIGIPREKRESVFENYVQVKDGNGGTGLGLGIVQSLVRLMGGEISIKDKEPGERGTCFAFNVLLKMSERQEPDEDIEAGPSVPSDPLANANMRASAFQEPICFRGVHCVLYVHGDETRRILQAWMECAGVKVWPVPQAELIASTLDKAQQLSMAPGSRSPSPAPGFEAADRCFSSKEVVSQVLPAALWRGSHGGQSSAILVIVDVTGGGLGEIFPEMVRLARIKHQAPCKVVLLEDLKTPSDDLRKFKELGCDLVLRKPVHGSRLFELLMTLRDLQVSDAQAQPSSQVGPEIAGNSHQQDLPEIVVHPVQENAAPTEATGLAPTTEAAGLAPPTEPASLAQEQKAEDDKPLAGMHILLAEDTLVLQMIEKKMLNQIGATVSVAGDGSKALNLFKEALEKASVSEGGTMPLPYHIILMDCQMPIMDGYEATKLIREEESRYGIHTPIIALTAHEMDEDLQKAIHAGMDLHLTKPIERKRILEAISRVSKRQD